MSELINQLTKFREEYYTKNKKNIFFKSAQKNDCAEKVTQEFSLEHLLQTSIYTHKQVLFFNYPMIKSFIHPGIYNSILAHINHLFYVLLEKHETITIHVDMKSFTVTAAQRHSNLIQQFCNNYLQNDNYVNRIQYIYVQNSPAIIDVIRSMFAPFISSNAREKITFFK